MSQDAMFVFGLIGVAGILMASNRVRYDFVALLVVLALVLSDTLTLGQALSGFGSSVVILVACLLVMGEMLDRTGVARAVGDMILKYGGNNETRLLTLIMISAAFLGSVMSSTAVVAIFIPIVLRIAADTGLDKARMLLPMSYAALISGMLTLIATTPNLVISDELAANGLQPLGFFSFFPLGIAVLCFAIVYMLVWGRGRLKTQGEQTTSQAAEGITLQGLWRQFELHSKARIFEITTPLRNDVLSALQDHPVSIVGRSRAGGAGARRFTLFRDGMDLQTGDRFLVIGSEDRLSELESASGLQAFDAAQARLDHWIGDFGFAEVMVHPSARILGQPAVEAIAAQSSDVRLVGMLRDGAVLEPPIDTPLETSDLLFLAGSWDALESLTQSHDTLVLVAEPGERAEALPAADKFYISLAILAGMVLLSLFNLVPITVAVLLAALAAVIFRTLSPEDAYRSISLPSLVLIAGMLPLADALMVTGGSALIVDQLLYFVGEADPRGIMAALFLITAALGLVLSNTASAVLMAPIAIAAAEKLTISPYPLAICVLIAASAAFSTPVSTPVVTLVVAPGGYRFVDFLKLGVPLTLGVGIITVWLAPIMFPY